MQPSLTRLVAAVVDLHPGAQLPLLVSQRHHKRVHAVVVQRAAAVGRGHLGWFGGGWGGGVSCTSAGMWMGSDQPGWLALRNCKRQQRKLSANCLQPGGSMH